MDYELISVPELAEKAKISKQTAYSILRESQYSKYCIDDNGIKKVSAELLEVLQKEKENKSNTAADTNQSRQRKTIEKEANNKEIEVLQQEIKELKEQIRQKDSQIAEFAIKFADLAQQAQIIAGQAQMLQASEKKQLSKPVENIAPEETEQTEESIDVVIEQKKPEKKSFWAWLLG